jgi:hypothetical protein
MKTRHILLSASALVLFAYPISASADKPAAAAPAAAKPAKPAKSGEAAAVAKEEAEVHREYRSQVEKLHEELSAGKITKDQFKDEVVKLHASFGERAKDEANAVKQRWGALVQRPDVHRELADHARRMAYLDRATVVTEQEVSEPPRAQLLVRIKQLRDKEVTRHEAAMKKLSAETAAAAPAPSAKGASK